MTTKTTRKSSGGGRVKLQTSGTARASSAGDKAAGGKAAGAKPARKSATGKSAATKAGATRAGATKSATTRAPRKTAAGPTSKTAARRTSAKAPTASADGGKASAKSLAAQAGKTSQIQKAKRANKSGGSEAPAETLRDKERRALALSAAELAIESALDKKAVGPVLIDVSSQASYTDYIGIVSGRSDRQVEAIADHVSTVLKGQGWTLVGREGTSNGRWTLLDFGDMILHIFYHPVRDVYDIEGLWAGAPRITLKNVPPEAMHFQGDALYVQP